MSSHEVQPVAIVTFVLDSAQISLGVGKFERDGPLLSFGVRLKRGEAVELTTGEKFGDLVGRLNLFNGQPQPPLPEGSVGRVDYFKGNDDESAPPSYVVSVWLSQLKFDELLNAARLGRLPSEVVVDVDGISLDGERWDNAKLPRLTMVESVSFSVPLFIASSADVDNDKIAKQRPPTHRQVVELKGLMVQLAAAGNSGIRAVIWMIVILGALMLYLRWK